MRQFNPEERIDSNKLEKFFWYQFITATLILNPNGMDQIIDLISVKYRLDFGRIVFKCRSNFNQISVDFWYKNPVCKP